LGRGCVKTQDHSFLGGRFTLDQVTIVRHSSI
jgi:hypothetical protein